MQARTRRFLERYCDTLAGVDNARTAERVLPAWQAQALPEWRTICGDLNASLGLAGDSALLPHIPTTYVGSLAGLVVVAANPGWSARRNRLEHKSRRRSVERNREFVRDFFRLYPQVTHGTSGWWTRVLRLHGRARGDSDAAGLRGRNLWQHAHTKRWAVGGLDLVPFHSARDGVTPLLMHPQSDAAHLLREVARRTLRMCLRIKPRVLLVASHGGTQLFNELKSDLGTMQRQQIAPEEGGLWFPADIYRTAGTRIAVLPRQVFSGRCIAPRGYDLSAVALLLRTTARS